MEKAYKNIAFFFLAVTIIVFVGFYNTYFVFFPHFEGFVILHHVHGLVMILWIIILIIQPILINNRKCKWHSLVGKLSYFLMPIIVISMMLAYQRSFLNSVSEYGPVHSQTLSMLFLPLTDVLPFAIFYILAIINKRKIPIHMRFMISTAVVLVGAGLGRIFAIWLNFDFINSVFASVAVLAIVFVGLIVYDISIKKFSNNRSFLTALVIFSIPNLLLLFIPYTHWWQTLVEALAN